MSTFFDDKFPGVRSMLERERDANNARAAASGLPWHLKDLNLGVPEVISSHATRDEAMDALRHIRTTCAPFIRSAFWVEGPNGETIRN